MARPCRRACGALAHSTQGAEGVDAGLVAVGPDRREPVAPHEAQIDQLGLLRGQAIELGEAAGQAALATALGAGALPAERLDVVDPLVAVAPLDAHQPLIDVDGDILGLDRMLVLPHLRPPRPYHS